MAMNFSTENTYHISDQIIKKPSIRDLEVFYFGISPVITPVAVESTGFKISISLLSSYSQLEMKTTTVNRPKTPIIFFIMFYFDIF